MHKYDITILTDSRYDNPAIINDYSYNVMLEDRLLKEALERKGLKAHRTYWDNPDFDWTRTRYAIFRTTWDYFDRIEEFMPWLEKTAELTQFINPISLLKWNMDKHYLRDLQQNGIEIPDTIFIEKGEKRALSEISKDKIWTEFILKPAISGAARHTYRFSKEEIGKYETIFTSLIANESMLLQEFQKNILTKGEIALMLFGGRFSHAVLKLAKAGDFRVQDDFGGTVHDYTPTEQEIALAEKVITSISPLPAYARVDIFWDNHDKAVLSELEMIEPELWFRKSENAANMLASHIFKSYF
jgi:glutathione synthase/RimK-type ligase-like ATP-grasp enzyme